MVNVYKEDPLISVVIPTYNREKVVKSAMESVLGQSYTNLELIIADDCSKDGTEMLVKDMMQADARIKYIRSEKNLGAGGARNLGVSIATGEYVAFNDSDAVWQKDKLKKQLAVFWEHKSENPRMVFHAFLLSDQNEQERCRPFETLPKDFEKKSMMQHLLREPLADTSTIMLTMQTWREIGGFNEQLRCLEDYEFSLRIAADCKVLYFHEPLITTYYSIGSVNQNWKEGIRTYFFILEEYSEWYRKYEHIKWERLFHMWILCEKMRESNFFEEQLLLYVKKSGEDVTKMLRELQLLVENKQRV